MKLHQLRYFQCLAHYLHYRKASEALYISQPTLSFAIKELGKKLGVALFKKEGRTIQLSQEGKIFLDYVSKSLQILDEGIHAIQPKKEIKISSIPTVINSFLVPFIIHLQKEQPHINIQFRSEKTETITQKILENQRQSFTIYSSY
ncbi:LysR family transcriptional regulator [Coprobacillus sp. AF13-15]|uniref:LysR family transcriptional regulator n=1 Tax=Faecalibacillus intestinalis TaxID=1982626 RepID=UPI000E5363CF|nr:LysR family transcriptional regulator [Faecalibacillus intestinalis]RHP54872.1 LysR family transcriptional regulator [Coprobacillus sp. AF31-1BH]RHP67143.1 LysR family transcriptional regulator [Coprobacillus sp. OF03-2AA]RHS08728.1 LysR family transcriptional regulator [Coprobacillus sp. AF13-4LB]RHS13666.1 LysR family transcriptional regulator [Coprobacillus sp. AF13-25]RHS16644.1 LysR family transcriptional regulator [Coprobacillus sp. AF13-15]